MEAKKAKKNKVRGIKNAFIVIIICFIVALVVFTQVLGAPENFEGGDPAGGHPLNLLGTIYKGGFTYSSNFVIDCDCSFGRTFHRYA